LDQFIACWEGLEDPRTGNAGLHDFHELLIIALCTCYAAVRVRLPWSGLRKPRKRRANA